MQAVLQPLAQGAVQARNQTRDGGGVALDSAPDHLPVSIDSSATEQPLMTRPSVGMRSPGATSTSEPAGSTPTATRSPAAAHTQHALRRAPGGGAASVSA